MTIAELLKSLVDVKRIIGDVEKEVKGIEYDSRRIKKDFIFVAVKGFSVDGHDYLEDAVSRGAAGVVVEEAVDLHSDIALVEVTDTREALSSLSAAFYGQPSRSLPLIAITGTNGKTTTGYITKSILEAWGKKAGLLGTIQYIVGKKILPALNTTPESLDLQRYLKEMLADGMEYGVIEVSSHALALNRVGGCLFKVAAFTNFSQDHLDFHKTMQEYFKAKSMLFNYLREDGCGVINYDDPMVRSLTGRLNCRLITCGLEEGAMLRATNITDYIQHTTDSGLRWGLSFDIQIPDDRFTVESGLVGRNNVYNILMSVGIAYALGIDKDSIIRGIKEVKPVAGRFEKVDGGQEFLCIVDYAHTEDALRNLIQDARLITKGRVITVFGCGGDRDTTKRPKMGAVASDLSDFVVVTSDNPRTEDPMKIIKDITAGMVRNNYIVEPDRAKAIEEAAVMAEAKDTVLIAGKGHEDYQEIKGVRYPFSDKEIFIETIKKIKK